MDLLRSSLCRAMSVILHNSPIGNRRLWLEDKHKILLTLLLFSLFVVFSQYIDSKVSLCCLSGGDREKRARVRERERERQRERQRQRKREIEKEKQRQKNRKQNQD